IRRGRHPEGVRHLMLADKPLHTDLRRISSKVFSPADVARLEDTIRKIARDVIATIEPGTTANIVDVLSAPIPIYVIAAFLGIPRADWEAFRRWSDSLVLQLDAIGEEEAARHRANISEAAAYFIEACEARQRWASDDVLSLVANGVAEGRPLSPG